MYLPYIPDSSNVARVNEASAHSWDACPSSASGVNRGARGHGDGPVGPVEALVKVGRFGEYSASRGLNLFVSFSRSKP